MTDQLLVTLVAVVLVLGVAVALALYVIRHYLMRSATWKRAEGRIVHPGLETIPHPRSRVRLFGARVGYEYQVGGRT